MNARTKNSLCPMAPNSIGVNAMATTLRTVIKNRGSIPVVEQVQVMSHDSYENDCHLL